MGDVTMTTLTDRILFQKDPQRFEKIRQEAAGFSSLFIGPNIIQDDIFSIIENYVEIKGLTLEWIRFPMEDDELCACTFIRKGRIFVAVNTSLPLSKQIFAAAHELYHIHCYLNDNNSDLTVSGSILEAATIDQGTLELEEMEANAFAGLLLVPSNDLLQQIRIFRVNNDFSSFENILSLMDIFAIPYKAMTLRLYEEGIISDKQAKDLLSVPSKTIQNRIHLTGKAKRWEMKRTGNDKLGSLIENLTINTQNESLPKQRLQEDWNRLNQIKHEYGIE